MWGLGAPLHVPLLQVPVPFVALLARLKWQMHEEGRMLRLCLSPCSPECLLHQKNIDAIPCQEISTKIVMVSRPPPGV
jgi:hypothetical protein